MFLISISGILSQNFICCFRFVHYCIIPGYLARTFCFLSKIFKGSFSPRPGQQQNPLCSTIGNTESNECVDTAISGICIKTFIRFDVCYFEYKGFCCRPLFDLSQKFLIPELFDLSQKFLIPELFDLSQKFLIPELFDLSQKFLIPELFDLSQKFLIPELFDLSQNFLICPRTF